jgi:hypothetical protein
MVDVSSPSHVFRAKLARTLSVYCVLVGLMAGLSAATVDGVFGKTIGLIVGLLLVMYGLTVARKLGVETKDGSVVIHHPLGSRRVAWRAIDHFEMGNGYPWRAWMVLSDGTRLKTWGLGASGLNHRSSMKASQCLVDDLNGLVGQHRGGGSSV